MVIDLRRSEDLFIQVTYKVSKRIVERETGDGTRVQKGGISSVQCSFYFSDYRDNTNRLLKLSRSIET